jgi:antitoxin component YwqK of YwqJK toxin-antitoxin module/GH24 family phage-related lysozyme (muramidase)
MSDTKKKLFVPRRLSGEDNRYTQWNKEQIEKYGRPINQYTHDGKKTGIWEEYHNGKLWSKGPYKDDIAEGEWEWYYDNGNLHTKGLYKDGNREDIWETYWTNGKLEEKGSFKDDLKDGIWEEYDISGNLVFKGLYKDDELVKRLPLNESETPKKKLFVPRRLSGEDNRYIQWNKEQPEIDGVQINQYTHDGKKTGIWEKYHNGQLRSKGSYKEGNKDGMWEIYNKDGQLEEKGPYKDDIAEGEWEWYYDNGNLHTKGLYKDGKRDGVWEWYDISGNLVFKGLYKDDELVKQLPLTESETPKNKLFIPRKLSGENSKWMDWNKEQIEKYGEPINQYTHDGKKTGIWEYYWSNGKLRAKGEFYGDRWDGVWEWYHDNGILEMRELYKNGKLVKRLPLKESETPSFLLKEEMTLIREGKIEDYINNILSKIKNLPYETKKKYLTIAISTLLGYTSYPVIQSIFDNSPDKEAKEIVHRVMDKKDKFSMFKDGTKLHLSKKGFNHIVNEEKPKLIAYALGDGKITIGYGHAEPIGKTKLKVGQKISEEQAKQYLKQDLKTAADGVRRMFSDWKKQDKNFKVTQDMFDALVSLAFNIGVSGLRQTDMVKHLKNGDYKTAGEIIKQTKIDPDTFPGLEKRRGRESNMFLSYLSQNNKINA